MIARVGLSMEKLGCTDTYETKKPVDGTAHVFNFKHVA